jgi:hypothetical protein
MSTHKPSHPTSWNRPIFRLAPRRDADWWERLTGPDPVAPNPRDQATSMPAPELLPPSRLWEQAGRTSPQVRGETGSATEKLPPAPAHTNRLVTLIGCLVFAAAAWLLFQADIFSPTWWIALTFLMATLPFTLAILPGLSLVLVTAALVFALVGWLLSLWVPDLHPPVSFTADQHIIIQLPGTDSEP